MEGVITFISPCLLPMLPVYVSYFAGGSARDEKSAARGALGFVLGFTLVFTALGAFAGFLGGLLRRYETAVNVTAGAVVVLFGLNYLGVVNIRFLNNTRSLERKDGSGFLSAVLFGIVFAVSWTPCAGAFLGSALMLASQRGSVARGVLMLLCFSAGLGAPFILCALLIERLKDAFDFIKKHYKIVNLASGIFLIAVGLMMATGAFGRLLSIFTF